MGEWLRRNPCFYQKSMKEYKDISRKNTLWADKAAELHVESGMMLKTWYESIRTKVGKLNDKTSGSAAKSMTDRDNFILAHFAFLQTHICRLKGRTAVSLKPSLPPFPSVSSGSEMEVEDDLDPLVSQRSRDGSPATQSSATQPSATQSSATQPSATQSSAAQRSGLAGRGKMKVVSKRKVSQRSDDDEDGIMAQLRTQQQQATKIQGEIQSILSREQQSATAAWGAWVGAMANQVDHKLHPRMYRESLNLMLSLVESSANMQPQPDQPVPVRVPQPAPVDQFQHQQSTSYVDMMPPFRPMQSASMQQQTWGTSGLSWDTPLPTAGQTTLQPEMTYQQQQQQQQLPRPQSTPNLSSQSSFGNVLGLSDLMANSPGQQ